MAVYRQVHTTFWQDPFVLDQLDYKEKYFYLYLLTNSKTTQCGIYEISEKVMQLETGLSREEILSMLDKFIDFKKVKYNPETKEIYLVNWIKYNPINNTNIEKCVVKELETIKDAEFRNDFIASCIGLDFKIPIIRETYKGLIRGLHTPTKKKEKEEEKEEEKEYKKKNKKKEYAKLDFAELVKISPEEYEKLVERFGEKEAKERLINLSLYIGSTGKKYKSHYLTILNWDRMEKQRSRADPKQSGNVFFELLKEEGKT